MDFTNKALWPFFTIDSETVYVTKTILSTWIIMIVLTILTVIVRIKLKTFTREPMPGSFQNLVELCVDGMHNFAESKLGKNLAWMGAYFFGVFAFILACNYSPLFGLRPPTSDLATTIPLAMNTFFLIHYIGITRSKSEYFKEYIKPFFLFLPVHVLGELSRPISFSCRLFGVILGGKIILTILYEVLPWFLVFWVPSFLHAYLEILIGSIQAFIFCVLSMTFIHEKASLAEEE